MGAISGILCRQPTVDGVGDGFALAITDFPGGPKRWTDATVGFAHVGDESGSGLCHDAETDLAITADIHLDDRAGLCHQLDVAPEERADLSDCGLVLRAYRKWGTRCPEHLIGDYSLAVWDARKRTLFCARDHIGAKPFYYCALHDRFLFASDLTGLMAIPDVPRQLNESYVAAHLLDEHFEHRELTFVDSVRKLPPACSLSICGDVVQLQRYWEPSQVPEILLKSDGEYAEAFLELYQTAIRDRLRGTKSVGVHLSGGLDSSSIAVLAARELRSHQLGLKAYCWEPPCDSSVDAADERALIQAVSQQERLDVQYQNLTAADVVAVLKRDVVCEPTVDTLAHEQPVQRNAQADQVRILLSGWGGDEFIAFNGRGYAAELFAKGRWGVLYQHCQDRTRHPWRYLARRAILPFAPVWCSRFWERARGAGIEEYLQPDVVKVLRKAAAELQPKPWRPTGVRRTQLQLLDLGHLTRRIESWAASGARHNLEYRYPLLDRRIIQFALGLPPEQFIRGANTRYLMRNAIADIVPHEVQTNRDKSDRARSQVLDRVALQAYSQIRDQLRARSEPPSRSKYINTSRLIERMGSPRPMTHAESSAIWHALQFLDF
jgi:asparagine synthase (glutamine-hydrolysing)